MSDPELAEDVVIAAFLLDRLRELRARRERALLDVMDADEQDQTSLRVNWDLLRALDSGDPAGAARVKDLLAPGPSDAPAAAAAGNEVYTARDRVALLKHLRWSTRYHRKLSELLATGAVAIEETTLSGGQILLKMRIIHPSIAYNRRG